MLFEDGLLVGAQHAVDELGDLCSREHGRVLEGAEASVDPDSRLGATH